MFRMRYMTKPHDLAEKYAPEKGRKAAKLFWLMFRDKMPVAVFGKRGQSV